MLEDVVSDDARVDKAQHEIDARCLVMLAVHKPVAVDLRTIVSVLKINTDLERVSELAFRIREAAQRYVAHPQVKALVDLPRMGELALKMLKDALHACFSNDVALAKAVLRQDDWLDALHALARYAAPNANFVLVVDPHNGLAARSAARDTAD